MSVTFYRKDDPHTPCINMSNRNAYAVMAAAMIAVEPMGELKLASIPFVVHNIDEVLKTDLSKHVIPEKAVVNEETGTIHYYDPGIDHEYIRKRLEQLRGLLKSAIELERDVVWG